MGKTLLSNNETIIITNETVKLKILAYKMSQILNEIIQENRENEHTLATTQTNFSTKKKPKISILNYLERIIKHTEVEGHTLILALTYLDKIAGLKEVHLTENNIHRFLLISIVVSIKYNEDDYLDNKVYAQVGGIKLEELNKLEIDFLELIDWKLFTNEEVYLQYKDYFDRYDIASDLEENSIKKTETQTCF